MWGEFCDIYSEDNLDKLHNDKKHKVNNNKNKKKSKKDR